MLQMCISVTHLLKNRFDHPFEIKEPIPDQPVKHLEKQVSPKHHCYIYRQTTKVPRLAIATNEPLM